MTNKEVDWSKVEVDTPILVRDCNDLKWYKRHFADYVDEIVYAWDDGRTSWSCNVADAVPWDYAKLAESEECEILRLRGYSSCLNYIVEHPKEAEKIVMKCAKDNPIKTNADKFKEVFGFTPNKKSRPYPISHYNFWQQEYKEPKGVYE